MYKKILIATFALWEEGKRTPINGMIEPLLSYFLPRTSEVDLIEGLHPGSSQVITRIESYKNGKLSSVKTSFVSLFLKPLLIFQNKNATQLVFKIRDLLSVLEWATRTRKKYDLFIGLESVYTLAGIILRKLGLVKIVVYYVSDYSPNRYPNKLLNRLYLLLDKFCAKRADYIWDVSPVMMEERIKAGLDPKNSSSLILVPNALFKDQLHFLPLSKLEPDSLVYTGTLGPENGPQLAISAMPEILKVIPGAKLHIIGGDGMRESYLRRQVKKLKLEKNVFFHGFIKDVVEVSKQTRKYMVGLAPYVALPNSPRWFADATKIRLYLGVGLPVVTTHVPPLGQDVKEKGAAIIVKDNGKAVALAVIKLLSDKNLYKKMREEAISFAKENTWENSYSNALLKMSK